MSNDEMIKNRFAKWAASRKKVQWIQSMLAKGYTVCITNHMRSTQYSQKHAHMFIAKKSGAYVQCGKKLLCIDNNKISAI